MSPTLHLTGSILQSFIVQERDRIADTAQLPRLFHRGRPWWFSTANGDAGNCQKCECETDVHGLLSTEVPDEKSQEK